MYHRGAQLADIAIEEYYTPTGARWWQERLTVSEIGSVIHTSIDELAPLNSTAPSGNYFAIICALLSVHTTDMEAMRKLGSLFESRIDACLSSSPSSNNIDVLHADIRSWSETLVRTLSNLKTVDLRVVLSTFLIHFRWRLLNLNSSSESSFQSRSICEIQLYFGHGDNRHLHIFLRYCAAAELPVTLL